VSNQRASDRAFKMPVKYRLIRDNQRTLKCMYDTPKGIKPCLTKFRVKIVEPGVYERECKNCHRISYFALVETGKEVDGLKLLRFNWLTPRAASLLRKAALEDTVDLGIARNVSA